MSEAFKERFLYIFLDEAGNLDFSRNGTKYFVLGGITKERPFHAYKELTELKYDQVERGTALEYFHAAILIMAEMGTPGEGTRPTRWRFCGGCRPGALTRRGAIGP